jgi:ribose transport system permease protein
MASAAPAAPRRFWTRTTVERIAPAFVLAALLVATALGSLDLHRPGTWVETLSRQPGNWLIILRQSAYPGIVALGMTFVIIGGGIDLSVGSMQAFVGVMAVEALNAAGQGPAPIALAFLVAMGAGALLGLFNGLLITKGGIAPFIVTLGTMSVFRSQALWLKDAGNIQATNELYEPFGGSGLLGIATPIWIWVALAALLSLLLNQTAYGRHLCAVGSREKVAQYAAIRVDRTRIASYLIVGVMVGVSAVLWTARLNSMSTSGFGRDVELDAITAVIIGGTPMAGGRGSIWGTVVGAIILGVISNMLTMVGVNPYLQGTVKGLVIIAAAFLQKRL